MNNRIKVAICLLFLGFAITSSGWVLSHDMNKELTKVLIQKNDELTEKSTKIARLGDTIEKKDNDLKADKTVIDKQKAEINKLKKQKNKLQIDLDRKKSKLTKVNFSQKEEGDDVEGRRINVKASAYIAHCTEGCTGRTATGVNVSNSIYYQGHRVIAVDTNIIPLNSLVRVETNGQSFTAQAIDTGGGIDGHEIDLLVGSTSEALNFGKRNATITVLREGA